MDPEIRKKQRVGVRYDMQAGTQSFKKITSCNSNWSWLKRYFGTEIAQNKIFLNDWLPGTSVKYWSFVTEFILKLPSLNKDRDLQLFSV